MMMSIVLSPRAFLCEDKGDASEFYGLMIAFLRDIDENGCILVEASKDGGRETTKGITAAVDLWPHKYRIPTKALLTRLRNRHRFIDVRDIVDSPCCAGRSCRYVPELAKKCIPDAVLMSSDCSRGSCVSVPGVEVFSLCDYTLSGFAEARLLARRMSVSSGGLTQDEVERRVFTPLLRYARHVKVIDRYIGRSVPGGSQASLGVDYQRSLNWICDMYQSTVRCGADSVFEIWCGLDVNNHSAQAILDAVAELRKWESEVQRRGVRNLRLHIKRENHLGEMSHARYLITDQIAVLVDRGFDVLMSDSQSRARSLPAAKGQRRLKDCEFVVLGDTSHVIAALQRLQDV